MLPRYTTVLQHKFFKYFLSFKELKNWNKIIFPDSVLCKVKVIQMDFGIILNDSVQYAKEGVWGKWKKWFFLIVSMIIFPFILGYMVRIYHGEKPAPELDQWGSMFIDGLKLLVVELIYAAPVILLVLIAFLPFISTLVTSGILSQNVAVMTDTQAEQFILSHPEIFSALATMVVLIFIAVIFALIIAIFLFIGAVRFARTGLIAEGFNFSAILGTIRKIGWINYLLVLIIIGVTGMVYGFVMNIVMIIPFVGPVIWLFLYPPFIIFMSRYASLVYDAGQMEPEAEPVLQQ